MTDDEVEIPGFNGELLPFQIEDVAKLISVPAGLNCNEMGCGKTIEAIAMDMIYRQVDSGPTLVIAPLAAVDDAWAHWLYELTDLDFTVINPKNREASWAAFTSGNHDVFVTHWQSLLKMPELASQKWMHVIGDEIQYIENRKKVRKIPVKGEDGEVLMEVKMNAKTKEPFRDKDGKVVMQPVYDRRRTTTDCLKAIKTMRKLAMSGTPMDGSPARLWSVLNWLYPQKYRAYWKHYNKYMLSKTNWAGFREEIGPNLDMLPELHRELEPFFVRHLKKDVVPDLPEKYYSVLTPALTTPQQRIYNSLRKDMLAWINKMGEEEILTADIPITQFGRLHQAANATLEFNEDDEVELVEPSNKIDCLVDEVLKVTQEPVIVFTAGTNFLDLVQERLQKECISFVRLDGTTSRMARTGAIERFQSGNIRVFLGTVRAAGVGITLTAASTVVFLDETDRSDWNAQAEDRAWRIGQKNAVHVIHIRSKNTVDQDREKRVVRKADWFRRTLGDSA
jgi:SNF2 family DNA or RNA helicase